MEPNQEEVDVNPLKTMGRCPTKGELIEYYSRSDICAVIYYQSKRWRISTEFGVRSHMPLEPTSEKNAGEEIVKRLLDFTQGVKETEPPKGRITIHMFGGRATFMTEDDPPSQRAAFDRMASVVDVLDAHDAFYQIKFSGHRSLHLIIPVEAFPKTFRGKSIVEQSSDIKQRLDDFLPPCGHKNIALRLVYSTHGGLVSIPLRRKELPNFRPWMANIHTVAVDFDWFEIPADAVERNERFLHTVFDSQEKHVAVSLPTFGLMPVKTYTGDSPRRESDVLAGIDAESPKERVAAARAANVQNLHLPHDLLRKLLRDADNDVVWFGMELGIRHAPEILVEEATQLLARKDMYISDMIVELFALPKEKLTELLPIAENPVVQFGIRLALHGASEALIEDVARIGQREKSCAFGIIEEQLRKSSGVIKHLAAVAQKHQDQGVVCACLDFLARIVPWGTQKDVVQNDLVLALIDCLRDKNKKVRRRAASVLGEVGEPARTAIPVLKQTLRDNDKHVRREVARALGRINT